MKRNLRRARNILIASVVPGVVGSVVLYVHDVQEDKANVKLSRRDLEDIGVFVGLGAAISLTGLAVKKLLDRLTL